MHLPFKMHRFKASIIDGILLWWMSVLTWCISASLLIVTINVITWITCPANQRSSSPTPCFSDRLRWGMTRGSRHRYHRKYYERITSNIVKGYVRGDLTKQAPLSFYSSLTDRGKWKNRGVKDGSNIVLSTTVGDNDYKTMHRLYILWLLMVVYVPVKCRLCWKRQRWRCAGNSRRPGRSERPMTLPTAGWAVAGMLPGQATGSTCCLHRQKTKECVKTACSSAHELYVGLCSVVLSAAKCHTRRL